MARRLAVERNDVPVRLTASLYERDGRLVDRCHHLWPEDQPTPAPIPTVHARARWRERSSGRVPLEVAIRDHGVEVPRRVVGVVVDYRGDHDYADALRVSIGYDPRRGRQPRGRRDTSTYIATPSTVIVVQGRTVVTVLRGAVEVLAHVLSIAMFKRGRKWVAREG